MNLLAIDSCDSVLSVAVSRTDTDEIFYMETEAGVKHSELVMDCIDVQMKKAGLQPGDLNGVLCMGGPGSFTGLRIGFSIAKGLALSLSIPFAPVPTLDCIAFSANSEIPCGGGLVIPVIAARKNAWFFAVFRENTRLTHDMDATAGEIAEAINEKKGQDETVALTGPGAGGLFKSLPEKFAGGIAVREKNGFARELIYIEKKLKIFHNDNSAFLYSGPEYIRKTDAEINLTGSIGS